MTRDIKLQLDSRGVEQSQIICALLRDAELAKGIAQERVHLLVRLELQLARHTVVNHGDLELPRNVRLGGYFSHSNNLLRAGLVLLFQESESRGWTGPFGAPFAFWQRPPMEVLLI